ncbi:MAG: DUF3108 domain-containing protein [Burkholderiales bacterium]|nr:DUF3108 domain-containing protein [Burkholderiales bacterium]
MTARTACLLAASLLLLGTATAQEVPAPTFVVGDSWTFREIDLMTKNETGVITETVVKADAAEYVIDARRKARTWWRGDQVKHVHREQFEFSEAGAEQRGKTIASNDAGCAYPYPLKVGASWECTEVTTWPSGWKIKYDLKFSVEAAESIETPAGKFDTLRIVAKGFSANETNGTGARHERVLWVAPAAKREVKYEIRSILKNGNIFRVEGRELTAMKTGA